MSIGTMNIFTGIYLFIFAIYGSRKKWYNIAILGEEPPNFGGFPTKGGNAMPVSKSQQKAVHKYVKANYDRMELTVPKGKKDIIKAHAETQGESVNGFINRAIDQQISQDCDRGPSEAQQGPSGGGGISLHPEALQTAQNAAQKAGETVSQFVERAVDVQAKRDEAARKLGDSHGN